MGDFLTWQAVEAAMDSVEAGDGAGVCSVFWTFEGRALETRDGRGARQTVNMATFCGHFGLYRNTFRRWLRKYEHMLTDETDKETA